MTNNANQFRQCDLHNGDKHRTAWIPAELAVEGDTLKLRIDGEWQEGWLVHKAFQTVNGRPDIEMHAAHKAFGYFEAKNAKR